MLVTKNRLARAKTQAIKRIIKDQDNIIKSFERSATRRASRHLRIPVRDDVIHMIVDIDFALQRVRNTIISNVSDNCYGEADMDEICISNVMEMTDEELIGTVIHEALHYICQVNRGKGYKDMCTRDEHLAMYYYSHDIQEHEVYFRV